RSAPLGRGVSLISSLSVPRVPTSPWRGRSASIEDASREGVDHPTPRATRATLPLSSVLLNAGDAIERFAEVDTVLFDKTGTLTLPGPEVVNADEIPAARMELAGRLALASSHPLAATIARAAKARTPLEHCTELPGRGVSAGFEGIALKLGSPAF